MVPLPLVVQSTPTAPRRVFSSPYYPLPTLLFTYHPKHDERGGHRRFRRPGRRHHEDDTVVGAGRIPRPAPPRVRGRGPLHRHPRLGRVEVRQQSRQGQAVQVHDRRRAGHQGVGRGVRVDEGGGEGDARDTERLRLRQSGHGGEDTGEFGPEFRRRAAWVQGEGEGTVGGE